MQLTTIYNTFAASLDTSLATIQNDSSSTTLSAAEILSAAGAGCDRAGGLLKARFAASVNLTAELAASDTASATTGRRLLSTSCSATAVSVVSVITAGVSHIACWGTSPPASLWLGACHSPFDRSFRGWHGGTAASLTV